MNSTFLSSLSFSLSAWQWPWRGHWRKSGSKCHRFFSPWDALPPFDAFPMRTFSDQPPLLSSPVHQNLYGSVKKSVPPAVGLLITGPPGKSPMTFYIRDLNICGFLCLLVGGVLESIPHGYQGTTVLILTHLWLWDVYSVTTNWRVFHGTNPSS